MKLFVDTAHVPDLEALVPLGIVDGVTTNPSLLAKVGGQPDRVLKTICDLVRGPVSAEVVTTEAAGMVQGRASFCSDRRPHRRESPVRSRGYRGVPRADQRGYSGERHAGVFFNPGAPCS